MTSTIPETTKCWSISHPLKADFSNLTLGSRKTPVPTRSQVLIKIKVSCYPSQASTPATVLMHHLHLSSNLSSTRPSPHLSQAISLNARDCQIASGTYPAPIQVEAGIIGGSDGAGDIVALGPEATKFKIGDRVTPIFAQTFLHGLHDTNYQKAGLGGGLDGVLSEYFVCDEVSFAAPA